MTVTGLAFVSYRRDDTSALAQSLYLQLKARFGSGQLFMDVNSIRPGEEWPARIRSRIEKASAVVALIGPQWLLSRDRYGRRRLDFDDDWVRLELSAALRDGKPIIQVLVGDDTKPPPAEALPADLGELPLRQTIHLRTDPVEWAAGVRAIGDELLDYGLTEHGILPDVLPVPSLTKARTPPLGEAELSEELRELPGWEPWEDSLAREYPRLRQELRKNFVFPTFDLAAGFMTFMTPRFSEINHHPRWGNEWKIVQIRLSTWDARNRITSYDIEAAHLVETGYKEYLLEHR
jgi:pterin-4a-carbinolamine dehydratase